MQGTSPRRPDPLGGGVSTADLAALRTALLRYARHRLHNSALAEDAVSETLLAAFEDRHARPDRVQPTAWLFGILRHKLVDQLRQLGRETPAGDDLPDADSQGPQWFVGGSWAGVSGVPTPPEDVCDHRRFERQVLACCDQLPRLQRQAFVMRELRGDGPDDVCRCLGITEGHLWVLVHRARQRIRAMLVAQGGPAAPSRA